MIPGIESLACGPLAVPEDVMAHVVHVESSRNPFAIGVVGGRLLRQPRNLAEAVGSKDPSLLDGLAMLRYRIQPSLTRLGVEPARLRMLRSFDPRSEVHAPDVEDPYYGDHADFVEACEVIGAALPGLHRWVDEQLAARTVG